MDIVKANPYLPWSFEALSTNPNITMDIVKANPDIPWNFDYLSENQNITWNDVKDNLDKPWDFEKLSRNPSITWDIVQANLDKPWNFKVLSENTMSAAKEKPYLQKEKCIKDTPETKMEDFTLTELKNIARDEGLSGWSKFKKEPLFDFLVANDVDIAKYKKPKKCTKKTKKSVVIQALDENIDVVNKNLNVKTKNELCKNLAKKKKEDIVRQALEFNIDINRPNGKAKTSKELLEDISLKLLLDEQIVPAPLAPPAESEEGASASSMLSKCLKKKKKDVVTEAILLGINITRPNGKVKTVQELCKEIELLILTDTPVSPSGKKNTVATALVMGINISHHNGKVKTVRELEEEIELKKNTQGFSESINVQENSEVTIEDGSPVRTGSVGGSPVRISHYEETRGAPVLDWLFGPPDGREVPYPSALYRSSVSYPFPVYRRSKPPVLGSRSLAAVEGGENSSVTECVVTDEGNQICIKSQSSEECVVTPNGDIACNSPTAQEICVTTQVCAIDDNTGEETCVPVNVCANETSAGVLVPPEAALRRTVDIQDIERQLAEILNPITSHNQNIVRVKETVCRALGLI